MQYVFHSIAGLNVTLNLHIYNTVAALLCLLCLH